jgi:hypothetical protein
MLTTRDHNDYDRLYNYIQTMEITSPFPRVRHFSYLAPITYHGAQGRRLIP